jgi:hypothetical protein
VRNVYVQRDSVFNTCELWIVTTSFRTLPANRHIDSSAKLVCASQSAMHRSPWRGEPWNRSATQKLPVYFHHNVNLSCESVQGLAYEYMVFVRNVNISETDDSLSSKEIFRMGFLWAARKLECEADHLEIRYRSRMRGVLPPCPLQACLAWYTKPFRYRRKIISLLLQCKD